MNKLLIIFLLFKINIEFQESKFYGIWDAEKFCPRNENGDFICNINISEYKSRYEFDRNETVTIYEGKLNNNKVTKRKFMIKEGKLILKVNKYEIRSSFIYEFAANDKVLLLTIKNEEDFSKIFLKKREE